MDDSQILDHLIGISKTIGSMDSKLDSLTESLKKHLEDDDEIHKKQDERIKELEDAHKKVKWIAMGAGGVIATLWRVIEMWVTGGSHH